MTKRTHKKTPKKKRNGPFAQTGGFLINSLGALSFGRGSRKGGAIPTDKKAPIPSIFGSRDDIDDDFDDFDNMAEIQSFEESARQLEEANRRIAESQRQIAESNRIIAESRRIMEALRRRPRSPDSEDDERRVRQRGSGIKKGAMDTYYQKQGWKKHQSQKGGIINPRVYDPTWKPDPFSRIVF